MQFTFSDEQLDVQQKIRDCCRRTIAPGAADLDAALPDKAMTMIRENTKALAREGLLGLGLPKMGGGPASDLLSSVLLHQELGESCAATALSVLSNAGICARALCEWGGQPERESFLEALLAGETIGAFADLEPEASLDAWTARTRASVAGGGFSLTGNKAMVVNAPLGGVRIVTADVDGKAGLFLVTPDATGIQVSSAHAKLGCRGVPTADVSLNGCGAVRLSPEEGERAVVLLRAFEHLLFGAVAAGMIKAAMETAGVYARDHQAGDKPLARHQETSFKLAEMLLVQESALMLLYRCVWMMEEKNAEAPVLASSAKVFASEAAVKATGWAVQITGQEGYQSGSRAERLFRDAKILEILGDCTEKHRMFVADQVLASY